MNFQRSASVASNLLIIFCYFFQPSHARPKSLSDEDLINPKRLLFNRVVPLTDSFDGSVVGSVFISKRSIVGTPDDGVIGEPGSPRYKEACFLFCPARMTDIDATYVYVIEKKSECTIAVRAIGWTEFMNHEQNNSYTYTSKVQYTSKPENTPYITLNGNELMPIPGQNLSTPYGSNYKYFPRNKTWMGYDTTEAGFITDLIYFDGEQLPEVAKAGSIIIGFPFWHPSRHVISGTELVELSKLLEKCNQ